MKELDDLRIQFNSRLDAESRAKNLTALFHMDFLAGEFQLRARDMIRNIQYEQQLSMHQTLESVLGSLSVKH